MSGYNKSDNNVCSQQFAQHIESQKKKDQAMNENKFKKSMSTSPLYRSTIGDIVDEDNVVLITEELKVFVSPFLLMSGFNLLQGA